MATLAIMNVTAVVSLRGLPAEAVYGPSSAFYYLFAAVVFLIPTALVAAELAAMFSDKQGGVFRWVGEAFGARTGFLAVWLQWIESTIWYPTVLTFGAVSIAFIGLNQQADAILASNKLFTLIMVLAIYWVATFISLKGIGWVGKEFYPYRKDGEMELETDAASVSQMIAGLTQEGTQEAWLKAAETVRAGSISRATLAGSFASPLLHWLKHRVFLTHVWHDSRGGKTATLKLALSVWGDPVKLLTSYHATAVGLERSCAAMMHLPLGLDELQALAEKRMTVESIVYSLGNGFGKLRGAKNGGLQKTLQWRNIILSTGEMPLIRENSMDGVSSRVLELYGRPIAEESTARELHQVSERNYGHAGKRYIEYLTEEVLSEDDALENLYRKMQNRLREEYQKNRADEPGVHFDNIAVLCLGDYLSSVAVFALSEEESWAQAVRLGTELLENNAQLQPEDSIQRAWDFTVDWIGSNREHFRAYINSGLARYGSFAADHVNIIQSVYRKALEDAGFSYAKSVKGFVSRGWFDSFTDADGKNRSQYQCKINGVNMRVFRCRLKVGADDSSEDDFLK